MPAIALAVVTVAAAGYSAYSQYKAGKAQQAIANENAKTTETAANYNADLVIATEAANAERIRAAQAFNARVASMNSETALMESAQEANLQRASGSRILASQRARVAASGVVGDTGSPLVVQVAQAGYNEMHALETMRQGQLSSNRFLNDSATETWNADETIKLQKWQAEEEARMGRWAGSKQANLDRASGAAARSAGTTNAIGTLLQGGARAFGQYYGIS